MDPAILKISELTVAIQGKRVIDGISLDIGKGEVMALVGGSGSGKTLTAMAVMDLLPSTAVWEKGEICFRGRGLRHLDNREKRRIRGKEIGMVFQEPFTSLNPVMRVRDQIGEVLAAHKNFSKPEMEKRSAEALNKVKLPVSAARAYPHQLSGGMRQRVMLAMALVCEPELLMLDEPTTALDVSIQKEMLDLISGLQDLMGFAVLFITHDFSVVNMIADTVAVMKNGRIVEKGVKKDVLMDPHDAYTKQLIECVPRIGDKRKRLPQSGDHWR